MASIVRERARAVIPPSLMESTWDGDGFESAVLSVMDFHSFSLRPDADVADLILKAKSASNIPTDFKKKAIDYRRSIILALVGNTNPENPCMERLLARGYLTAVKAWLDNILQSPEGQVDMLLHLLSNIANLPVNKFIVKESGMGKAVGTIDKHIICNGTPNEAAITVRVQQIKDSWQKSVKLRKGKEEQTKPEDNGGNFIAAKRKIDPASPVTSKRSKGDDGKNKGSSFSSLLKKVSSTTKQNLSPSPKVPVLDQPATVAKLDQSERTAVEVKIEKKKVAKRVKWMDHFGGQIAVEQYIDTGDMEMAVGNKPNTENVSWSDRKKRDRLLEKALLAKVKRVKLLDDDDDELFPTSQPIRVSTQWRIPALFQLPPDVVAPQLESPETRVQNDRINFARKAVYTTPQDVPDSPHPLTDVEQALDMTSQASASIVKIPYFAPQQPVADSISFDFSTISSIPGINLPDPPMESPATLEYVQSLGLPAYLVGQPVKTLKTLSESPSLLNTMVDAQGFYDRNQLMNLVHALNAPTVSHTPSASQYQPPVSAYGAAPLVIAPPYGMPPVAQQLNVPTNGFRIKSDEGNLHVIGYGPGTTESDLIAAFAPYVHVDEVVMKGTFSFVNTSDPVSAMRAKAALTGTLIGGMPIRINNATRKTKDFTAYGGGSDPTPSFTLAQPHSGLVPQPYMFAPSNGAIQPPAIQLVVPPPQMEVSVDNARDDRGNPATKNLFVAGYGQGTTEQELRDLFSKYSEVTGVISKGNFSFVNTSDRAAAVRARLALSGSMFNGGVLRINFAKETGRLGTSFDLTYGRNTGPNARRSETSAPALNQPVSYYGRGF